MAARAAGRVASAEITASGRGQALRRRVDVEAITFEEADQGLVELSGERDRKARWSANGGEHSDARGDGFLHYLVPGAPAHDKDRVVGGQAQIEERTANHLVDSVVASHVLAEIDQVTACSEQACCMEPAGAIEDALARSQSIHQVRQQGWVHCG